MEQFSLLRVNECCVDPTSGIEVVRQGDTVARSHLQYLMFAVAVKGCPLDCLPSFRTCPVKDLLATLMSEDQLTTFVDARQANDEGSHLVLGPGRINVSFEFARRCRVYLCTSANRSATSTRRRSHSTCTTQPSIRESSSSAGTYPAPETGQRCPQYQGHMG